MDSTEKDAPEGYSGLGGGPATDDVPGPAGEGEGLGSDSEQDDDYDREVERLLRRGNEVPYEEERASNIARNKAMLKELGLIEEMEALHQSLVGKAAAKPAGRAKAAPATAPPVATRRSGRNG
jgi:hypothetical protein